MIRKIKKLIFIAEFPHSLMIYHTILLSSWKCENFPNWNYKNNFFGRKRIWTIYYNLV